MEEWLRSLIPWGTDVILTVQSHSSSWLATIAKLFTYLGYEELYLVLLPFVYWCVHKQVGIGLGYIAMLSAWTNSFIKDLFKIPRPSDPGLRVPLPETSPSFPSGHAQNAVTNWGYLALRLRRPLGWIIAVILMLGIGLSRIVLGVHFPEDVIGGWIIGLVLLALYAPLAPVVGRWTIRQRMPVQVALVIGVPFVLIFLHPSDPGDLYPAESATKTMSALIGMGVGLLMERAWLRFQAGGPWGKRLLRFLVGAVIVIAVYALPKLIVPEGLSHGVETVIRFVRYVLLGWVVAFGCPWLFVRLKLAARDDCL
jgi:membrane-associated phospholipid phosphatase